MGGSHLASGILGLAIAGIAWVEARTFPLQDLQEGLGAAFMPWLVLGLIVLLSLALIGYGLVRGETLRVRNIRLQPGLVVTGGMFLLLCGFAAAFGYFGLLGPVLVFLIVGMRMLRAPWPKAIGIGTAAGLCIYAVFAIGFGVSMP